MNVGTRAAAHLEYNVHVQEVVLVLGHKNLLQVDYLPFNQQRGRRDESGRVQLQRRRT